MSEELEKRLSGLDRLDTTASSARLVQFLSSLPTDPSQARYLADVVVVSLGAFERYYVCWINGLGEYHQAESALPDPLRDWLFPANGTTRDFESLQVVLGHRDEFFASDRNGKISHSDSDASEMNENKKADSRRDSGIGLQRKMTMAVDSTTPTVDYTKAKAAHSPNFSVPIRSSSGEIRRRSPSLSSGGRSRQNSTASSTRPSRSPSNRGSTSAYAVQPLPSPPERVSRSQYADASTQTDAQEQLAKPESCSCSCADGASSTVNGAMFIMPEEQNAARPVVMGLMSTYFNSSTYQLGDMLARSYC